MTVDLGHWTFNGYDFRAAGIVVRTPVGPGQLPPLRGMDVPLAGVPGQFRTPKVHDERTVTFDLYLEEANPKTLGWPGVAATLDDLSSLFGDTDQHPLTYYAPNGGVPRTALAEVTAWLPADQDVSGFLYLATVTFMLADPYFYGPTIQVAGGLGSATLLQVVNPGKVPVRNMQFYINGPVISPSVLNLTNNVSVTLAATAHEYETLTIDCAAWTATYMSSPSAGDPLAVTNVIGGLSHLGDTAFMRLDPGVNLLQFSCAGTYYPEATFQLIFQAAYL